MDTTLKLSPFVFKENIERERGISYRVLPLKLAMWKYKFLPLTNMQERKKAQ